MSTDGSGSSATLTGTGSSTVLHELDEAGVLTLTLNRPENNNGWTREMEAALHTLLEEACESEDVRVIVLTGAGRSFCPGLDSKDLDSASRSGPSKKQAGRRPILLPALVPKPVVCAINGGCAGIGLVTALMADVRFAAEEAKITTAYARRGLPAEEAISWILPRVVGHGTALDLLLSSRVVLGSEAAALGLVHWAAPRDEVLSRAQSYARDMAVNCSPLAMATAKRQVYADWRRSLADSRRDAKQLVPALNASSTDFSEGLASFVEKRAPHFTPYAEAIDYSEYPPDMDR